MRAVVASVVATLAVAGAASTAARADQCQLVDSDIADWAAKWLVKGASVIQYCEPCNDKGPGKAAAITKVDVKKDGGKTELSLNGKGVDLAHTFVQTGKWTYTNVAVLAGCQVNQVSTTIDTNPSPKSKLPASCAAYEANMKRLQQCDKMPQAAKDAMQQGLDAFKSGWKDINTYPAEAIKAVDDACKQANDAVAQTALAVGC